MDALRGAVGQVREDLRTDPYLGYILLGALLLTGFWFWHRIPSFATRDERARLLDSLVAYGRVIDQPSLGALQEGLTWGRGPFGATLYLFGLAALPVVIAAAIVGDLGALTGLGLPGFQFGYYEAWQQLPRWMWTWSLVAVRLCNVAFAVGCVYLTYRLGTAIRGRQTGRLSAVLLTLTFGFLTIAHEGGEDMPALFFVLLTLYLGYRYIETGYRRDFLAASVTGGVAIAFKLTAAPVILVIVAAYLLRAGRTDDWLTALWRPKLFASGAALGAVTILAGFPTVLVAGPEPLYERLFVDAYARPNKLSGPRAPVWWWFLRGYFNALSLPLFVAAAVGVVGSVLTLRSEGESTDGTVLLLVTLVGYLAMFATWNDFRVHHLLPTFPLLMVLLAGSLVRFREWRPAVARPLMALLLVTSGTYAVAGDVGYAFMPRDQATDWLNDHTDENATMEVYRRDFQDAAVPYEMEIRHDFDEDGVCPEYIQVTYRDKLLFKEGERYRADPRQESYMGWLLDGQYNYTVAASFGPQPGPRAPHRPEPGSLVEILPLGVIPQTDQYSDEQELAVNQYTTIYRRVGPCSPFRDPPF